MGNAGVHSLNRAYCPPRRVTSDDDTCFSVTLGNVLSQEVWDGAEQNPLFPGFLVEAILLVEDPQSRSPSQNLSLTRTKQAENACLLMLASMVCIFGHM